MADKEFRVDIHLRNGSVLKLRVFSLSVFPLSDGSVQKITWKKASGPDLLYVNPKDIVAVVEP
jgi:hypothetical protein